MNWTSEMELSYLARLNDMRGGETVSPVEACKSDNLYVKNSFLDMISNVANVKLTHVTYNVKDPSLPRSYNTISCVAWSSGRSPVVD